MTDKDPTQAGTVRLAIEREIFNGLLAPAMRLRRGDSLVASAYPGRPSERPLRNWLKQVL